MNFHIEAGKQKLEHFKRRAKFILRTIVLGMTGGLLTGCGYVNFGGKTYDLHDHGGKMMVRLKPYENVPYDQAVHGEKIEFLEVGQRLPNEGNSTSGQSPIHRHLTIATGSDGTSGSQEYRYE